MDIDFRLLFTYSLTIVCRALSGVPSMETDGSQTSRVKHIPFTILGLSESYTVQT